MLIYLVLLVVSVPFGLISSAFLMIAAWFAWSPLPMIVRMPVGLLVTLPFGLVLACSPGSGSQWFLAAGGLFLLLGSLFVVDTTWLSKICLGLLLAFILPVVLMNLFAVWQRQAETLDFAMVSHAWIAMLGLAALISVPRWLGYRLSRVLVGYSDSDLSLASGHTLDQWLRRLASEEDGLNWNHAQTMSFLTQQGVPFDLRKDLVDALFRASGRPSSALLRSHSGGGPPAWLQWATTGSARPNQYSIRQLAFYVTSAAIFFALIARIGLSESFMNYALSTAPLSILLAAATVLMAMGVMFIQPPTRQRLCILMSVLCTISGFFLAAKLLTFTSAFRWVVAILAIGTSLGLWCWMSYLRREGFRLLKVV